MINRSCQKYVGILKILKNNSNGGMNFHHIVPYIVKNLLEHEVVNTFKILISVMQQIFLMKLDELAKKKGGGLNQRSSKNVNYGLKL